MTKVFDDKAVEQAFRDAERALAQGDPDTLAGRFSPRPLEPKPVTSDISAPALPIGRKRKLSG